MVLIIAGCAGSRPSSVPTDSETTVYEINSVMDSIWMHPLPTSIKAEGSLSMKTPLYTGPTMRAEITHRRADSLLMVFRLYGIEGGRMLITRDSLFFYDRLTKTLSARSSNHPALPPLLRIDHALEQMLGLIRPSDQTDLQLKITSDGVVLEDSLLRRAYTIDPEYWRIVHVAQMDTSGNLLDALYYSDFFSVDRFYFPRRVIYRNPAQDINIILSYRSITVNTPVSPMSLNLPEDIARTLLLDRTIN